MPELPEVETTRRGIEPVLKGQIIKRLVIRQPALRWPIPGDLPHNVEGQRIERIDRRAKYLLLRIPAGAVLVHLGMSGSLRIVAPSDPLRPHDHVDFVTESGQAVRYHDPRRFGSILWQPGHADDHPLLASLGPEPLGDQFSGERLYQRSRGRRVAVKSFIMSAQVVVGVGNIYASEALYRAGIRPTRAAGRVSLARYEQLAQDIREVLSEAIEQGGSTLRDFVQPDAMPGYFAQQLAVYDRAGKPCHGCGEAIKRQVIGQRASYFCGRCQR